MKKTRTVLLIAVLTAVLLAACGRKPEPTENEATPTAAVTPAATPTTAILPEATPMANPTEPADVTPSVTPDPMVTPEPTPIPDYIPPLPAEFTTDESLRNMIDEIGKDLRYSYVEHIDYQTPSEAEIIYMFLDEKIQYTQCTRYYSSDFMTLMEQYLYHDDVIFTVVYNPYGCIYDHGGINYNYAVYQFDELNQCLADCYEPNSGNYYTYDDDNRLTATATYRDGTLTTYSLYEYDDHGRLVKETLYDPADFDEPREQLQYTYDDADNIVLKSYRRRGEDPIGWFYSGFSLDETPGEYIYDYHKDGNNRLTGWTVVRDDGSDNRSTVNYKVRYYPDGIVIMYRDTAGSKDPDGIIFRATGELEEMLLNTSGSLAQYDLQNLYYKIGNLCSSPEVTLFKAATTYNDATQRYYKVPNTIISDECSKMLYYGKIPTQFLDSDTFDHDLLRQYAEEHPTDCRSYYIYDGEKLIYNFEIISGDRTTRTYQYDSEDRLISLLETTSSLQLDIRFRYDEEGRLAERTYRVDQSLLDYDFNVTQSAYIETCQFSYGEDGTLQSISTYDSSMFVDNATGQSTPVTESRSTINAADGVIPPIKPSM